MTLTEFDNYMRAILALEEMHRSDPSQNGLQVSRQDQEIRRVAVAVDSAMETFQAAVKWRADLLFVHHGLFWGREQVLTGTHYRRIKYLLDNDLALYAVHLPLDANLSVGNNAQMAQHLRLTEVEPFGLYKGAAIGVRGILPEPDTVSAVVKQLFGDTSKTLKVLPFGKPQVSSVGIISGGAPRDVDQAVAEGLDLFITGDASHEVYHYCKETGINVVFGGHYATETWGVRAVAEKLTEEHGLETTFLDVPTGL